VTCPKFSVENDDVSGICDDSDVTRLEPVEPERSAVVSETGDDTDDIWLDLLTA